MRSSFYCYGDEVSISVLESADEKVLLLGSDFGYGNFGDIAQMLNTISFHKEMHRHRCVIVMAADAIGDAQFPEFVRQAYKADGVIFVSPQPLSLDDGGLPLSPIGMMRNVGVVHLYGGGFLNDKWGDFVLGVTEYFLSLLQPQIYVASGEQVTTPFEARVVEHIRTYRPVMFGVRDQLSYEWMTQAGFEPSFSFDDATEALQTLTASLPLQRGPGLFFHLNVSGYTNNVANMSGMPRELAALAGNYSRVTMLQAYSDRRIEVVDTRESMKDLERSFPFFDYQALELAQLAYRGWPRLANAVQGEIGYSCSYHVALWLQLAGVPCWLRGSNLFYQQKRRALQVDQDFEAFLCDPKLADHSTNLERRKEWLQRLKTAVMTAPRFSRNVDIPLSGVLPASAWKFKGNHVRQLQEQSNWAHQQSAVLAARVSEMEALTEAERQRAGNLLVQMQELESVSTIDRKRAQDALAEADRLHGQISGLVGKVTELGARTYSERKRADLAKEEVSRYHAQVLELTSLLEARNHHIFDLDHLRQAECDRAELAIAQTNQIIRSRTWRWTRFLRFTARVIRGDWPSVKASLRRFARGS
ncbi:hypothetical protein [Paraburkholderia sp. J63]|uniref:hypothetical protein n=1 Tax=Paraburkholderia sp. J63 TaxID=2805434 RepID=UPI002ABE6A6C|nr:hypothetical protein [Paraburkholderia sp. J63]